MRRILCDLCNDEDFIGYLKFFLLEQESHGKANYSCVRLVLQRST